jgi:DNA modification methylase
MEQLETTDDWTFADASTREYTHVYHDYPARMIPQVARKLINLYGTTANILFDPYCGTGSSLVEGLVSGIDVVGTDINPLARLIAGGKTDYTLDIGAIDNAIEKLQTFISKPSNETLVPEVSNMDTWFKPSVIPKLGKIRFYIDQIENLELKRFFQIAFSETVRESSNTRKGEFKLYRYGKERLEKHFPDPYSIMLSKLNRNKSGLADFKKIMDKITPGPTARILGLNSVNQIPSDEITKDSIDIVVTSPPYGDSHTTVAYGQYSRLSSQWLSLIDKTNLDNDLMGGKTLKEIPNFPSDALNKAINEISEKNHRRALEVSAFYVDLLSSIRNVSQILRSNGHACYVVGNRTVSSIVLPTSEAIKDFFSANGLEYIITHIREIPNKRMPARNSPSNVHGETSSTMLNEHIVIMIKK